MRVQGGGRRLDIKSLSKIQGVENWSSYLLACNTSSAERNLKYGIHEVRVSSMHRLRLESFKDTIFSMLINILETRQTQYRAEAGSTDGVRLDSGKFAEHQRSMIERKEKKRSC